MEFGVHMSSLNKPQKEKDIVENRDRYCRVPTSCCEDLECKSRLVVASWEKLIPVICHSVPTKVAALFETEISSKLIINEGK